MSDKLLDVLANGLPKSYLQGPSDDAEGMTWIMLYAALHNKLNKPVMGSSASEKLAQKKFSGEVRKKLATDLTSIKSYTFGKFIGKSRTVLARYINSTCKQSDYWSGVLRNLSALQELDHLLKRDDLKDFKPIQNLRETLDKSRNSLVDCKIRFGDLEIGDALMDVKLLDDFESLEELRVINKLVSKGDAAVKIFMDTNSLTLTDIERFKEFKKANSEEFAKLRETKTFNEFEDSAITNAGDSERSPSVKFRAYFEFHIAAYGALIEYARILRDLRDALSGR